MAIVFDKTKVKQKGDNAWEIEVHGDAPATDIANGDGTVTIVIKSPSGATAASVAIEIPNENGKIKNK